MMEWHFFDKLGPAALPQARFLPINSAYTSMITGRIIGLRLVFL